MVCTIFVNNVTMNLLTENVVKAYFLRAWDAVVEFRKVGKSRKGVEMC